MCEGDSIGFARVVGLWLLPTGNAEKFVRFASGGWLNGGRNLVEINKWGAGKFGANKNCYLWVALEMWKRHQRESNVGAIYRSYAPTSIGNF